MRILLHSINYAPEVVGVGKYTGEMSEWLVSQGHEVRVVTALPYYPMWAIAEGYSAWSYRREYIAGASIWRCPLWVPSKPTGTKRLLHLASFAASSLPVMLYQVRWQPDLVILTEPTLFCAPHTWLTARLCKAKTLLHILDFELDAAIGLEMFGQSSVRHALYRVENFLMRGASRVSTISEAMRQRIVRKGVPKDDTWLFPTWADIEFVRPMPRDNKVRRELGAGPDDTLVLYAGNMGEKQGLDLVLEAADQLRERAEIRFVMIGAGAAQEKLEGVARKRKLHNMRFFSLQPLERLPLVLAAGDIHLVVQRRDAADLVMPSKLTNILAAGRPSIATVEPGTAIYEVLNEHSCGITTPPSNVAGLVEAIVMLSEDARMRERLGRNARRYAESYLDKIKILSEFERNVQELVNWPIEREAEGATN